MTTVIIEDEPLAAERLRGLLAKHPDVEVVAVLGSVAGAVAWFGQNPAPDLVLADIQLSDGLSFEAFEAAAVASPVVFTTSYDEYALKAFALHSVDYLLKPIRPADLARALDKFAYWRQGQGPAAPGAAADGQLALMQQLLAQLAPSREPVAYRQRFLVNVGEQLLPVPTADVAYFHTANELVYLTRHDGRRLPVDFKLEQLEKMLDPAQFFRLNRQFLASLQAIDKIHTYFAGKLKLELKPAPALEEVLVSRERAPALKRWLE